MHDKMAKMLHKKRNLSENEKNAKMEVVKGIKDMASEAMGSKLDGLKKVSVMSDSKQGLKHGLDKAKQIVSGQQEHDMLNDAEAPYSDAEHAHDEHMGEQGPNEFGQDEDSSDEKPFSEGGMAGYDDGGEVVDPDKAQQVQDSFKKALGFDDGGEVPDSDGSDMDSDEDGDDSEHMSEDEIDEQLARLMKLKEQLKSKKS